MILFQSENSPRSLQISGNSGHFKTHKVPLGAVA
nr:MAG TPA: hypothetical protein [Caudoviricetes sp.]